MPNIPFVPRARRPSSFTDDYVDPYIPAGTSHGWVTRIATGVPPVIAIQFNKYDAVEPAIIVYNLSRLRYAESFVNYSAEQLESLHQAINMFYVLAPDTEQGIKDILRATDERIRYAIFQKTGVFP